LSPPAQGSKTPPPADSSDGHSAGGNGAPNGPQQIEPPSQPGVEPSHLVAVVTLPFALWARLAADDRLTLTPDESAGLSTALAAVANKRLPAAAATAGPEIGLIMVAAMVMAARLTREKVPPDKSKTISEDVAPHPTNKQTPDQEQPGDDPPDQPKTATQWTDPPDIGASE